MFSIASSGPSSLRHEPRLIRILSVSKTRFILILLAIFAFAGVCPASPPSRHLSPSADYHRYIDPLVQVKDFKVEYYEDGAADASVLFPGQGEYQMPVDAVVAIAQLRQRSLPVLIDCLSDGRLTNAWFGGNRITARMRVPVGYVCMDLLMGMVPGRPVADPECSDDGLGSCMNEGFYFRPDDYFLCSDQDCNPRPWVLVVQRNWKGMYLAGRIKFRNPYDAFPAEIYQSLKSPKGQL